MISIYINKFIGLHPFTVVNQFGCWAGGSVYMHKVHKYPASASVLKIVLNTAYKLESPSASYSLKTTATVWRSLRQGTACSKRMSSVSKT